MESPSPSPAMLTPPSTTHAPSSTTSSTNTYQYPPHYSFPPFFTLQPNEVTRGAQLASWTSLLLSYCAHSRLFRLTPSHPVFNNAALHRSLSTEDARTLLAHMVATGSASWVDAALAGSSKPGNPATHGSTGSEVWVWTRSAEDWAGLIADWVENTGQRNTVLTFYELLEGDATEGQPFHGLPLEMAKVSVGVLVRRARAALLGEGEGVGVKFF